MLGSEMMGEILTMRCFLVPMPIADVGIDVARPSNELNLFEGTQADTKKSCNPRKHFH